MIAITTGIETIFIYYSTCCCRCMIIDDTGHIIMHPALFTNNSARYHYHLTQLVITQSIFTYKLPFQEPFVSQDLLALEYMKRIYCNNFQYNYNFTIHPRRQYSYVISEKVKIFYSGQN